MAAAIQPPAKGMTPAQYYIFLVNSGVPREVAMSTVQQYYGPIKSKNDLNRDAQKNKTAQEIAAAGGLIGGYLLTDYIKDNAGSWWNKITGKKVTNDIVLDLDKASQTFQTGNAASGRLGIQRPVPEVSSDGSSVPEIIEIKGDSVTVQTPDGGTQTVPKESLNDSEFWSNVNWGQVVQGGLALAQMYGAYKSFKSGDKVGGTINMAAGAGNLAAATGAVATGQAAAGATGAYVIPGLNILAGGYGGYKTAEALGDMAAGSQRTKTGIIGGASSGAAIGAGIGSIVPGPGTAIGAGIGALVGATAGAIGSWTGSHKGKAQVMRDSIRSVLQQNGILDANWQGTLADGSAADFGKDGSHLKWKNIDKLAAAQPKAWGGAVPLADALATAYGFVGQKASDISAMYARAAISNAGDDENIARQNMQHFAKQQGITFDQIKTKLDEAKRDNRISQSQYDYYMGGAQQLTGGAAQPANQQQQQQQLQRPEAGKVLRVSPGLYRNDQGKLTAAKTMREALEKNYGKNTENEL